MKPEATFAVPAPEQPSLPVVGSDKRFPVRRIYCIGRNYVAHVREMGGDETRDFPLVFQKPRDCVVQDGGTVPYPPKTNDFHFELELMVVMKSGGYDIPEAEALSHVFGYGICLDMTRRTLLDTAEGPRSPWELKKSFDLSAPCGPVYPVEQVGHPATGRIKLEVDGKAHQDSDLGLMIWRTPEIISTLSRYYSLEPGDVIMTGTPDGVGPVTEGNVLVGSIDNLGTLTVTIGAPVKAAA
ncbi:MULTISPECIES: fumarylacetoacetate hydrolase family protein [unclassified Agrobacterium]|jgi:fumarylpyruvate hydrolase|uniref:fumarylacetoacetate hydrolase family protein n=1 Tax=unclassified Agrobacterium TaxID=2632611 RepID=UPI00177BAA67|nr:MULTISPECIES: fumarylacetoacetate hydrolase family protein [unclassified Agrobacterium]MBD9389206.1 fumarylacetoacetate hydrolase family protein [Agrobacterium sp. AGB01]MDO5898389.1 fumarylacetoacetate hydrolase family protein [Agrobacterium sp. Azo12]